MKVKACPFCGGKVIRGKNESSEVKGVSVDVWKIWCDNCGAMIQGPTKEKAGEAWNRREDDVE